LIGISEERRQLENPVHRFKDNIKLDLKEVGWVVRCLESFGQKSRK
jgi:hypothetical protein